MKISQALKGRPKPPRSEKHCKHMSLAFKGKSFTERFGKERAEEVKKKISTSNTGQKRTPRSDEWRQNLSESLKGRSVWNKGKKGLQKAWNKVDIPKEDLYKSYVLEKKPTKNIAKEYDTGRSAVARAVREYGFPSRITNELLRGKTLEEIHGLEKAKLIRNKLSLASKGRKVTWTDKIREGIRNYYKNHKIPEERRKRNSERLKLLWKQETYKSAVIASHKQYLKDHPEELIRLNRMQYPGRPTSIEIKVRDFLNKFLVENKDFYYDKFDKTGQTYYRPDFQFPDRRLIIELDGHYNHFTEAGKKRDALREEELKRVGWRVIRFTQKEIDRNFEDVISRIMEVLNNGKNDSRCR